jgi:UDP-glucose 4-epimerase
MQTYENKFNGESVCITGGAGFIGSHLAHRLVELGATVRVIDDLTGGFRANLPAERTTLLEASIIDEAALRSVIDNCRFVFHEAAMVSVPESVEDPRRCADINIMGTELVLEAARDAGVQRVVLASSAAVYGGEPELPCREDQPIDCWSPYAAGKAAGEHLAAAFSRCYALSTVNLRYFNIFGPRQNPNSPYAAAICAFESRLRSGRQPTVFGDGSQTRDFCPVANVVHANLLAATVDRELAGEAINIGIGRRISLLDVLHNLGDALGIDATPTFESPRAGDVPHSVADITRARAMLSYEPIVSFENGLRELIDNPIAR